MNSIYLPLGIVVAVFSAARSTWSPCGLSMLSSITPFGERYRGARFAWTSAWFLAGAGVGGLTLGGIASILTLSVRAAFDVSRSSGSRLTGGLAVGVVCMAVAAIGAATDLGLFGDVLPVLRRQVDDGWMSRFRPWVYGAGFGWQIGFGFATYVMTAGIAVTFAFAIAAGVAANSVYETLLICVVFGFARGATVFIIAGASTPQRLRQVHRKLNRFEGPVKLGTELSQAASAAAVCIVLFFPNLPATSSNNDRLSTLACGAVVGVIAATPLVAPAMRTRRRHRGMLRDSPRRSSQGRTSPRSTMEAR